MYRTYSYNDMPIPVQRRNEDMRKPMPPASVPSIPEDTGSTLRSV